MCVLTLPGANDPQLNWIFHHKCVWKRYEQKVIDLWMAQPQKQKATWSKKEYKYRCTLTVAPCSCSHSVSVYIYTLRENNYSSWHGIAGTSISGSSVYVCISSLILPIMSDNFFNATMNGVNICRHWIMKAKNLRLAKSIHQQEDKLACN